MVVVAVVLSVLVVRSQAVKSDRELSSERQNIFFILIVLVKRIANNAPKVRIIC